MTTSPRLYLLYWSLLLLVMVTLVTTNVCLAEPIILKQDMQGERTASAAYYLEDPLKTYTFEQLQLEPLVSAFKPLPAAKTNLGIRSSDYWLRIDVRNEGNNDLKWLLEASHVQWDHVSFYMHGKKMMQGGDHHPFELRTVASESNVFEVNTPAGIEQRIWVHFSYDQPGLAETQLLLWTTSAFAQHYANRYFIIGAIAGFGIILVFYNLFVGYATRMEEFIWYTAYMLMAVIALFTKNGFGYRYLWSDSIWFTDFSPILFPLLMMLLANQFTRSFLNTAAESITIDRLLQLVFVSGGFALFFALIGWRNYALLLTLLCAFAAVFYPFIGLWLYKKGRYDARFYILGWSFWSLGMIVGGLEHSGVIPPDFLFGYIPALCLSIEGVLLSFALADRFNSLRNEKEAIELMHIEHMEKDKQILEELVTERTKELEQARDKAELLARTDVLTGTMNRRAFFECGDTEIERSLRYQAPLAVMMIDLDHFKFINDNYGHAAGDAVLIRVVNFLCSMIRNVDSIGRIGGEEFATLLPQTDLKTATELAERLRLGLEKLLVIHGELKINITACFGVTTVNVKHESLDDALKRADQALYQAKENGRNRVEQIIQSPIQV